MRFFKIGFAIVLLILVIVVFALGSLVLFFDPNKLTPILVSEAKKAGYDLIIDGKLTWSFFPRMGIQVPHMTVMRSQETTPFLEVSDLRMSTELARLWHRRRAIQGDIYLGKLRLQKLQTEQITTLVKWQNKTLSLDNIDGNLYNGTITGAFHMNESTTPTHWDWKVNLDSVALQPLLNDLTPESKLKLSGTAKINFQGTSVGKARDEIYKNLNGSLSFTVAEGAINGINLNYTVRLVDALLNKTEMPAVEEENTQTTFQSLTGNAVIVEGVATSDDLLLLSSALVAKGTGSVILPTKEIKFAINVKPQQDIVTQWEIPMTITGSLTDPAVRFDREAIAKFIASEQFQKIKDKATDFLGKLLNK